MALGVGDLSRVFAACAMNTLGSMYFDLEKTAKAFRGNGAISWGDHHPCLFCRVPSGSSVPATVLILTTTWIPALEGVEAKLKEAAGGGHRLRARGSVVVMASA